MATILVYTTPARGHLYPIVGTALALARRGHDVHVRTLASEVRAVEEAGLRGRPIAPAIEARAIDDWQVRSPLASVKRAVRTFLDRATLEIDDLRDAIRDERPDFLLIDTNAWGAQAVAEASGLPWATWHPFPLPYPSRDAPPFGPGLAPARGPLGRLRDRLLRPLVVGPFERVRRELSAIRAQAGAPPLDRFLDLFLRPPLLLSLSAEPFEYRRRDWPSNVRLVGPGLWAPPSETPRWLAELPASKPLLLVTCSSEFQDDGALVDAALGAFAGDERFTVVCTTAGVDPAPYRGRAPSVVVERFAPHAQLVPRAAAVVCHGGMGITQRALAAGVPPCVVPWGRDQLEVARRVVEAQAGAMLPRRKLTPARLRAAVDESLARAAGAATIAEAFSAAGGAERAALLVEESLRPTTRPAPQSVVDTHAHA